MVQEAGGGGNKSEQTWEKPAPRLEVRILGTKLVESFEHFILDAQSRSKRFICTGMRKGTNEITSSIQFKSK